MIELAHVIVPDPLHDPKQRPLKRTVGKTVIKRECGIKPRVSTHEVEHEHQCTEGGHDAGQGHHVSVRRGEGEREHYLEDHHEHRAGEREDEQIETPVV